MPFDSYTDEARTNAEQSETALGFRVNHESQEMLYFIRAGEFVKIGRSKNIDKRISQIQCGCPLPIDEATGFPGFADLESTLHERFAAHRTQGEWFRWNDDIARMVLRLSRKAMLAERKRRKALGIKRGKRLVARLEISRPRTPQAGA